MPNVEPGYCCLFEECLEMSHSLIQTLHTSQSEPFSTHMELVTNFKQFHMLQSRLGSSAKMLLIRCLDTENTPLLSVAAILERDRFSSRINDCIAFKNCRHGSMICARQKHLSCKHTRSNSKQSVRNLHL